jgi:hypothetical protein
MTLLRAIFTHHPAVQELALAMVTLAVFAAVMVRI